jgi:hypothetical protein
MQLTFHFDTRDMGVTSHSFHSKKEVQRTDFLQPAVICEEIQNKKTSWVWEHFVKQTMELDNIEFNDKVFCKHCHAELTCNGKITSNFGKYSKSIHGLKVNTAPNPKQTLISSHFGNLSSSQENKIAQGLIE